MAWQLHVLHGRIAWTRADDAATEAAWRSAIAVDPTAQLSGREVPPDVIRSYESVRAQVLAERARWEMPTFAGASVHGAQIEIDGVGGLRPVPPGEHFVVVHWPGARARAAMFDGSPIPLPEPDVVVPPALPRDESAAESICDRLQLDVLVMARIRNGRLGLQAYACGGDFGEPWYSEGPTDDGGTLGLVAGGWEPQRFGQERGVLLDPQPWPEPEPEVPDEPTLTPTRGPGPGPDVVPPPKPWYRRAWVWVLVGGVVAGAVTTGVVLGTREPTSSVVVTDDFLRP